MAAENYHKSSLEMCYRTTKIFEECSLTWTIENVSFITMAEKPGFVMKSVEFPSDDTKKCKWQVEIYPYGFSEEEMNVAVHLCLKSSTTNKIKTKCVLTFRDSKHQELTQTRLAGVLEQDKKDQKLCVNLNGKSVFEETSLEDDILKFEIKIVSAIEDKNEIVEWEPFIQESLTLKVIDDLQVMYNEQKFSDLMVVVKGAEYRVHRNILASRSSVFGGILESLQRGEENPIVITDIEADIFKRLLNFIYTGQVERTDTVKLMKIFVAADKYGLYDLKELCEEQLKFSMNSSNVLTILDVADKHNAEDLKKQAIDFICSNANSQVSFSELAKCKPTEFDNSQLLLEILAKMAPRTQQPKDPQQ